jgi:hypothetical protein
MIESEVARLRKLRASALRVRAVARALSRTRAASDDPLLDHAACAAWRLARTATGRLRAHPYARFQRDAGFGVLVSNALVAAAAVVGATNRVRAFRGFSSELRKMSRELEDARALTWAPDLSDSLGRALLEFRPLLAQATLAARQTSRPRQPLPVVPAPAAAYGASRETDWPYLAL